MRHETIEKKLNLMMILIVVAISIGGLVEIIPLMVSSDATEPAEGIEPYEPLRLAGRDIYVREGCYNCHSQMIRPMVAEVKRYGEYSKPGEFIYDRPFQWGSRRIGPDLAREGGKQSSKWHWDHFANPAYVNEGSVMSSYPHLLLDDLNFGEIQPRMQAAAYLGAPYTQEQIDNCEEDARRQAETIAAEIVAQGGPAAMHEKKAMALIAYLQRLGTDLFKPEFPPEAEADTPAADATAEASDNESAAAASAETQGEE